MGIRVTNWRKWQRTKTIVGFACFFTALGCAGGLEGNPTDPIPSIEGFVVFISLATAIMFNVTKYAREGYPR